MEYTRYTFSLAANRQGLSPEDLFDLLSALLADLGFESFVTEEDRLEAFIPSRLADNSAIASGLDAYPIAEVQFKMTSEQIADCNWNEEWEQHYFQPICLSGRCYVRAPFHPASADSNELEIIISPRMAFGTGHHATTSLIMNYLLSREGNPQDLEVLDMGCGSGILGILAAKLGAANVEAVDIDDRAVLNARENAFVNNVPNIVCHQGDARLLPDLPLWDLVLANITLNVLTSDISAYAKHLKSGGRIVCSGFFSSDIQTLTTAAAAHCLIPATETTGAEGWAMVVFRSAND